MKMSVPKSNFQGNLNTCVFCNCFAHLREFNNDCWTSRHLLCEKVFKYFGRLDVKNFVEK